MSKMVKTWYGARETDYPDDAPCSICSHIHANHSYAANVGHCGECDDPTGELNMKAFHYFEPTRFAGGATSPSAERLAYERALRGDA